MLMMEVPEATLPSNGNPPTVVPQGELARTSAGRALQSYELRLSARQAVGYLLLAAVLAAAVAGFLSLLGAFFDLRRLVDAYAPPLYVVALITLVLYWWALRHPLAATIVTLLAFIAGVVATRALGARLGPGLTVNLAWLLPVMGALRFALDHHRVSRRLRAAAGAPPLAEERHSYAR